MTNHLHCKLVKRNGTLQPQTVGQSKQQELFVSSIPDGTLVECFYEVQHDDGTIPQLAKLHVMIRHLANHIGETVENMKLYVKDKAGLCIAREVSGKEYFLAKSFGECSREELSLAIQAVIELGHDVGCHLG